MRSFLAFLLIFTAFFPLTGQNSVAISDTSLAVPDPSALLDVQSVQRGILVPRMSTAERQAISSPAQGLLVFDQTSGSFWYFDMGTWNEITAGMIGLRDSDNDTKVEVERVPDEDLVRFQVQGKDVMHVDSSGLRLAASDGSVYIGREAGIQTVPSGSMENTFVGDSAGSANIDGMYNTFIGSSAGAQNSSGSSNTFLGYASGASNSLGINNTFVGYHAGTSATLGLGNAFFGHQAGLNNTAGGLNTFIGAQSGQDIVNTSRNVFVGNRSGEGSTGSDNTFLGYKAGYQLSGSFGNGDQNVMIGSEAGMDEVGFANTFVGFHAGRNNSNSFRNVIVGSEAGLNNLGEDNVLLGYQSGSNIIAGFENVMIGSRAGVDASGSRNTLVGTDAGFQLSSGSNNVIVGGLAGKDAFGHGNVLIGFQAGRSMDSVDHSVMIGFHAGFHTSGAGNTFIGGHSGASNSTGENNTCVGSEACRGNGSGTNNTCIGRNTGSVYGGQNGNTFIGSHSGWNNFTGANDNTFVGVSSGAFNKGSRNTMIGYTAGLNNDTGNDNVFLGHGTGLMNTTGQQNTYLGKDAGHDATGSGNVCIGYQAGFNATGNQKLYIDNSSTSSPLIFGDFDNNALYITGTMRIAENPVGGAIFTDGSGMELSYIDELNTGYISVSDVDLGENGHLWLGHSVIIGVLAQDPSHRFTMPNNSVFGAALAHTWDTYSDNRIKSHIQPLQYGLKEVLALHPRSYWQHDAEFRNAKLRVHKTGSYRTGFIAQEVYQVIPEAVCKPSDESETLWSMDYDALIPVLVKAIQELTEEVDQLRKELKYMN